ncbi:MAG TPA: MBL fold metallo-hydrolase [Blastocatellia bacterium]|nr:MBL fold metallo-hydrolase [Blastocatellia bacterium]
MKRHVIGLFLTLILALSAHSQTPSQPEAVPLDDGQLHVVLVGTGSPLTDATRAAACTAVIAGGEMILIDTGPASWRKLTTLNLPQHALSAVLLTHFHSDHIGDLGEAMTMSWVAGRTKPLVVYGPPGVEKVVAGFAQAYALDVEYRVAHHGETNLPRAAAGAIAKPVTLKKLDEAAVVFERNGWKVTAFNVAHDPVKPAYGYRVEYRGRSVVISGDTAKSTNLAKHAAGADLLIHDVLAKALIQLGADGFERSGQTRRAALARDIITYHASPTEVAEVAAAAKVETLVFSHLVPPPLNPIAEQAFTRGVSDIFKGKVVLGKDGLRFDFTPK